MEPFLVGRHLEDTILLERVGKDGAVKLEGGRWCSRCCMCDVCGTVRARRGRSLVLVVRGWRCILGCVCGRYVV